MNAIRTALARLDPNNNEHWTEDGKPAIEPISDMLADPALNRAMLDAAAPDCKRPEKPINDDI